MHAPLCDTCENIALHLVSSRDSTVSHVVTFAEAGMDLARNLGATCTLVKNM